MSPALDRERVAGLMVLAAAIAIAAVSARDHAGGWNDGSRLATVENLVDRRTLAIDRSIFVDVQAPGAPGPYVAGDPDVVAGTRDKVLVVGRFYSDKPPVPALLMAVLYQILQWTTGLTARARPDRFCYWLTLGSSGLAYVVAVWCTFRLGRVLKLALPVRLVLTASFGLATLAPTYARHVNAHVLLLAVASALLLGLVERAEAGGGRTMPVLGLGTLAGLGYTIDLGAGPLLLLAALAVLGYRGGWSLAATALAGALPWLALHHAVTYAIGGTLGPLAAAPEYFRWPGSPFDAGTLTGTWNHPSAWRFVTYAGSLLYGRQGFVGHDLALLLCLPAAVILLRRRPLELAEILGGAAWAVSTWLVYAAASTNRGGVAASIRWFVPLLAPGYLILAVLVRDHPRYRPDLLVLSAWGVVVAGFTWVEGPWRPSRVPAYWTLQVAALATWALCALWRRRSAGAQA